MLVDVKDVSRLEGSGLPRCLSQGVRDSDRYKNIVDRRGKTRCVTIDYATNDFHVDIVPSVERSGQCYIMNLKTNQCELTDGDGYAAWFSGRNDVTGGAELVRVVRLCKYLRDEHDSGYVDPADDACSAYRSTTATPPPSSPIRQRR